MSLAEWFLRNFILPDILVRAVTQINCDENQHFSLPSDRYVNLILGTFTVSTSTATTISTNVPSTDSSTTSSTHTTNATTMLATDIVTATTPNTPATTKNESFLASKQPAAHSTHSVTIIPPANNSGGNSTPKQVGQFLTIVSTISIAKSYASGEEASWNTHNDPFWIYLWHFPDLHIVDFCIINFEVNFQWKDMKSISTAGGHF